MLRAGGSLGGDGSYGRRFSELSPLATPSFSTGAFSLGGKGGTVSVRSLAEKCEMLERVVDEQGAYISALEDAFNNTITSSHLETVMQSRVSLADIDHFMYNTKKDILSIVSTRASRQELFELTSAKVPTTQMEALFNELSELRNLLRSAAPTEPPIEELEDRLDFLLDNKGARGELWGGRGANGEASDFGGTDGGGGGGGAGESGGGRGGRRRGRGDAGEETGFKMTTRQFQTMKDKLESLEISLELLQGKSSLHVADMSSAIDKMLANKFDPINKDFQVRSMLPGA
jgi:hypothetical protein